MTDSIESETDDQRRALAATFDQPLDPLAEAASVFDETGIDPFALFQTEVLGQRNLASSTKRQYESVFEEWRAHMNRHERHPVCPNPEHVEAYIRWQTAPESEGGRGNCNRTVEGKLSKLNYVYEYWQQDAAFPHPDGYNPISLAKARVPLPVRKTKEHRRISVAELREMIQSVPDLRARTIIGIQLKLGLRAGEVANLRLSELRMDGTEAARHYREMGTHDRLKDYREVLYIPSRYEREGNKSGRPRLLPIDDELGNLLERYLLVRPDNGEPWLVLSQKSHTRMTSKGINGVWKDAFHPQYAETDEHRPLTSSHG
jgi:integrase/recombinase XerD